MRQLRRFLLPSVTFFFCFIFFLQALAEEKLPEIVKKIEPSTVLILAYDKDGKIIGQGSGFFINENGDIITNRHVLAGAHSSEVRTTKGKVYPIMLIVAEDKEADIIRASVNIPVEFVCPLSMSSSIPEVGERVAVIGNPLGLERTVSDGIVSAVREIPGFGNIYQITAPISLGSSGSPVINMKGEVIGVATFQFVKGQNLNFAIPGEKIAKLKKGKGKTLGEWEADQREEEERLATAEKRYYAGRLSFLAAEIGSHEKKDYKKALRYFEEAVKKNPRYVEAYFYIGLCNSKLEYYMEAVDAFNQAIGLKPEYAEARYNLGLTYLIIGNKGSALAQYEILKNLNNDLANKLFNLIYQ